MNASTKAWLALENGVVMEGVSVGAGGEKSGDMVFNTAMTGYQEILTDPSYFGQVVVMTYPLIGNYGASSEDDESPRAWAEAFVIREMSSIQSSRRADSDLPAWLRARGVVAIAGIDTRKLTRLLREEGCLRCVVSTIDSDPASLVAKARNAPATDGRDLTQAVTCDKPYRWNDGLQGSYPSAAPATAGKSIRCVAFDFGAKRNIMRSLVHSGFDVTVVPSRTRADEVLAMDPQAIFLSNGPGDPAAVVHAIHAMSDLIDKKPIFGICLGHQILSLVFGAKTRKMPFGHHGANHPVRDRLTARVEITSQNHSFEVDRATLPKDVEETHTNLNDGTVEGMRHAKLPVMSVQYHPEAAPGPIDSAHLFSRFRELVLR